MKTKSKTIQLLCEFCLEFIEVYDDFAISREGKTEKTEKLEEALSRDFIMRSRIHMESICKILPLLNKHQHFKSSIFLLLRGLIADMLCHMYLMTFAISNDEKQTSLINELDIIETDFVKAMIIIFEEERKMQEQPEFSKFFTDQSYNLDIFKQNFVHLFKDENIEEKLKDVQKLRESSNQEMFNKDQKMFSKSFRDEKSKHEWLSNFNNYRTMTPLYILYRYFSQFHHYSRGSMVLFGMDDFERDLSYILLTFSNLLKVSDMQYKILTGGDTHFSNRLNLAEKRLISIFE